MDEDETIPPKQPAPSAISWQLKNVPKKSREITSCDRSIFLRDAMTMITLYAMTTRCALKPQFARAAAQRVFHAAKPQRLSRFPAAGNCRNYQNLNNVPRKTKYKAFTELSSFLLFLSLIPDKICMLSRQSLSRSRFSMRFSNALHGSLYRVIARTFIFYEDFSVLLCHRPRCANWLSS